MEKVKKASLKREFFAAVTVTLLLVAAASALTVWGSLRLQRWLVPDTSWVMLKAGVETPEGVRELTSLRVEVDGGAQRPLHLESRMDGGPQETFDPDELVFSVESVDYGIGRNGPRRRAAYIAAGAAMGILPVVYAMSGTLLCAMWFYRKKLAPGITALDDAARHIGGQDLDFTVECPLQNELGRLCISFERMRQALVDNNLKLWRAIEERRTMQASVAHDLRNPLAIMEGLVEHMRELAPAGELTGERLEDALAGLAATAKRMERYTDYIRDLDAIEDIEVNESPVTVPEFLRDAVKSVSVLAEGRGLETAATYDVPPCRIKIDREIFYRVLENVFFNAVRYAASRVELAFSLQRETLLVRISDDGKGFSPQMLQKRDSLYYSEDQTGEHMGLGLATSRILCVKHGGGITLKNREEGGAQVEIALAVRRM